jgi:tetratricopeptide (TPR) repeat protein
MAKIILFVFFYVSFVTQTLAQMQEFTKTETTVRCTNCTHLQTEVSLQDYIATSIIRANSVSLFGEIYTEFRMTGSETQQKITTVVETFSAQTREVVEKKWNEDTLSITLSLKFDPEDAKQNLENYRNNSLFRAKADSIINLYLELRDSLQRAKDSTVQLSLTRRISAQNAEIYIIRGDLETNDRVAILLYERALRIAPNLGSIHVKIGDRRRNLGENEVAIQAYRNGIRNGGDTTYAMFEQARILYAMALKNGVDIDLAVRAAGRFRDVLARDSTVLAAFKYRGILQFRLAQRVQNDTQTSHRMAGEAVISLKSYLEENADDREARRYLYESYIFLGDRKNAALWAD